MPTEIFECQVCHMMHQEKPDSCERCSSKHFITRQQDAKGKILPSEAEQARLFAQQQVLEAQNRKQAEWEALLALGQKKMTDSEKLLFAQMQIMTELLTEIADSLSKSNEIASAPRYGVGFGTFFGDD